MKNLFFWSIFLIIYSSIAFPQWTNLNPVPDGNDLNSVFFIDDNIGWIAGSNGFIIKTTNTGNEWVQQSSGTSVLLKSIKFVSPNTGWIVGDSGTVITTTDGGHNWIPQTSGTTKNLNDIHFYDLNIAWAVGDSGTILRTSNGGNSWNLNTIDSVTVLNQVDFVNAFVGWTVGAGTLGGILLKTTDGGISWEDLSDDFTNENPLHSVDFINENIGSIGDNFDRTPFISTDGGYTWNHSTVTITWNHNNIPNKIEREMVGNFGVQDFYFTNDSIGYAVVVRDQGWFEYIYKTTDSGLTWTNCPGLSFFTLLDLSSLCVTEQGRIWAVGEEGRITISEDDGEIFSEYLDLIHSWQTINSVFFINENIGWAGGQSETGNFDSGIIYKTTDGGKYWRDQLIGPNGLGERIDGLFFIDHDLGWALENNPSELLATTNGGENWTIRTSFNYDDNYGSIFFINQDTGWVVNKTNSVGIYKTTDGGFTWNIKNSQLSSSLYFANSLNGWSVGPNGLILKSTDGGETWIIKTSGTTADLHKVKFFDSNLGMCVGSSGIILLTTDGGETWISKTSGTTEHLSSISFINPNSVWVGGSNGKILSTTDLGNSWTAFNSVTSDSIISLGFFNGYSGWAAVGTLFKYFDESGYTPPPVWSNAITVEDAVGMEASVVLTFGQHADATDSVDMSLSEYELPPPPPSGIFDARFNLPTSPQISSFIDLRNSTLSDIIWTMSFQPSYSGYPITLSWDSLSFPQGSFYLKDLINGSIVLINMKNQSRYVLSNPAITSLIIVYKGNCALSSVNDGWNMISVPYLTEDMSANNLFPTASSSSFSYENGYTPQDTLEAGVGYWLKFNVEEEIQICGSTLGDSVELVSGWNLFGVYDENIPVNEIQTTPPGILATFFFGFDEGYYIADTLKTGKGYWVRATQNGIMNFNSGDSNNPNYERKLVKSGYDLGTIKITDSNEKSIILYASGEVEDLKLYELPPVPPAGIFDVRYSSGYLIEDLSSAKEILIRSVNYPVTIKAEGMNLTVSYRIGRQIENVEIKDGEELRITNNNITSIEVMGKITGELPITYELYQNYPNPFNPSTTIKFGVSKESKVNVSIYSILGELVSTIVNEQMKPGYYEYSFDAAGLASGVYLYRIKADDLSKSSGQSFVQTKKMIMMK